jgi:hypothetical protein
MSAVGINSTMLHDAHAGRSRAVCVRPRLLDEHAEARALATTRGLARPVVVASLPTDRLPMSWPLRLGLQQITRLAPQGPVRPSVFSIVFWLALSSRFNGARLIRRRARSKVLSPKMLAAFVEREPGRLALEDIRLIAFHLGRYVKAEPSVT